MSKVLRNGLLLSPLGWRLTSLPQVCILQKVPIHGLAFSAHVVGWKCLPLPVDYHLWDELSGTTPADREKKRVCKQVFKVNCCSQSEQSKVLLVFHLLAFDWLTVELDTYICTSLELSGSLHSVSVGVFFSVAFRWILYPPLTKRHS